MTKRKRRQFTPEFKADAVTLVQADGRNITQIDTFYNPERSHSTLDYVSPIGYELKHIVLQQKHITQVSTKVGRVQRSG